MNYFFTAGVVAVLAAGVAVVVFAGLAFLASDFFSKDLLHSAFLDSEEHLLHSFLEEAQPFLAPQLASSFFPKWLQEATRVKPRSPVATEVKNFLFIFFDFDF
jgi:hypothetical protein